MRGELGGGAQGLALVGPVDGLTDKDHVHVGDVIQLVAPALAHRDHREPAQRGVLGCGRPRYGERGAQGRGGEVGEFGGGLGEVGGAAHVTGGDRQQTAAVGDAQGDGVGGLGEPAFELLDAGVQIARLVGDEGLPVAGVPGEMLGERGGRAEHPEQPVAQRLRRYHGVEQLPVGLHLQKPHQTMQREVGVGGRAERLQQHRVIAYAAQLPAVQQPLGGGRIGETVPQKPREGTAPAPRRRRHPRPPVRSRSYRLSLTGELGMSAGARMGGLGVGSWWGVDG
ncbi:hypothetical protein M2157_006859 [Streptomyces sp. SAI-127]|nr:hypothetical protein [Streptomyces sp. SAI-127]